MARRFGFAPAAGAPLTLTFGAANPDGSVSSLQTLPPGPGAYKITGSIRRTNPGGGFGASLSIGTDPTAQATRGGVVMLQWRSPGGGGNALLAAGSGGARTAFLAASGANNTFPNYSGWVPFELLLAITSNALLSANMLLGGMNLGANNALNQNNSNLYSPEVGGVDLTTGALTFCYNTPGFAGAGDSAPATSVRNVQVYTL